MIHLHYKRTTLPSTYCKNHGYIYIEVNNSQSLPSNYSLPTSWYHGPIVVTTDITKQLTSYGFLPPAAFLPPAYLHVYVV